MSLRIDPVSAVPPFEQLRTRLVEQVDDGTLAPGSRLPTVRALASELGIAVNTVARTYRELERDGVVQTRGRHGTFVAATGDAAQRAAHEAAVAYVARTRHLGVGPDAAVELVRSVLASRGEDPAEATPLP